MSLRMVGGMVLLAGALTATGCGGDNLALCDGCGTPIPTPTVTSTAPTPTSTAPTPTSTAPTPSPVTTTPGPLPTI